MRLERLEVELLDEVRREVVPVGVTREVLPHLVFHFVGEGSLEMTSYILGSFQDRVQSDVF